MFTTYSRYDDCSWMLSLRLARCRHASWGRAHVRVPLYSATLPLYRYIAHGRHSGIVLWRYSTPHLLMEGLAISTIPLPPQRKTTKKMPTCTSKTRSGSRNEQNEPESWKKWDGDENPYNTDKLLLVSEAKRAKRRQTKQSGLFRHSPTLAASPIKHSKHGNACTLYTPQTGQPRDSTPRHYLLPGVAFVSPSIRSTPSRCSSGSSHVRLRRLCMPR